MRRPSLGRAAWLPLALLLLNLLLPALPAAAQAQAGPAWQDSGLKLPAKFTSYCLDALRPGRLLVSVRSLGDLPVGTYDYNLQTGQSALLSERAFSHCSAANGLLFDVTRGVEGAVVFSSREPQGRPLQYAPTEIAADGSLRLYALDSRRLYTSPDAGRTWREIGLPFQGLIDRVSVSPANSRAVYILVRERPAKGEYLYTLHVSFDAGQSWERRAAYRVPETSDVEIAAGPGRAAPVTSLLLYITHKSAGIYDSQALLSGDGGQTFREVGRSDRPYGTDAQTGQFFATPQGILRFANRYSNRLALELSRDSGRTWERLAAPPLENNGEPARLMVLQQAASNPANLWLSNSDGTGSLWHSPDGGQNWLRLGPNMPDVLPGPYAPTWLLGVKAKRLYTMELPAADRSLTRPALPAAQPGALFFPETGHNLSPLFQSYWLNQGGLARFGFPRTLPFRELNPADGLVYTVQYFERNRFEYHPEHAGTPYEVQLGLLGNAMTADRRQETPFLRAGRLNIAGGSYFEETGHNLSQGFKAYWEANGGLSMFGFPVSEEFEEVNPDDGRTYVVQYFERNRFEYHPEQRGTPYEVLLGLLGNSVLRQKGWL